MTIILRAARLKNRVWWAFVLFMGVAMLAVTGAAAIPSITSQPQSRTNTCGVAGTFSITATGDAPLSYQWRFNGANLSGATGASLNLNPVLPSHAGSYAVVVSNGSGSVTSVVAQFVLTSPTTVYVDDNYAGLASGTSVNFPNGAGGATYTIGCDAFASIPAAIGSVASGGTINVAAGIYNSFITVNKPLNLRGPNAGITGTGSRGPEAVLYPAANDVTFGNILDVAANFVTVDGFELNGDSPFLGGGNNVAGADANSSCGIRNGPFIGSSTTECAYDINNLTVQNNVFRSFTFYGVYIGRKFGVTTTNSFLVVRQNKFTDLYECGKFYATHPDFSDNWASNCLYLCFNWSVTGPAAPGFSPRIANNRHFMSTDPSIWGAHSGAISAGRSIWIYVRESLAPPILVSNNVINFGAAGAPSGKDPHGITVDGIVGGRTVVVANNTINGFGQYADCLGVLNVDATSTVMVRGNLLTGAAWNSSSAGLFLTGNAGQITCLSNTILASYYGIFSAGKLTVRYSSIRSNSGGVEAYGSSGRVLLENSDVTGNLGFGLGADGGGILDAGDCLGANVTGLGTGSGPGGSSIGGNNLSGYGFDNASPWAIFNQNFNFYPAITAEKNNYGAGPTSFVGAVVYDASDNPSLSTVNFGHSGGLYASPPPNGSAACLGSLPAAPTTIPAFIAAGGKPSASRGTIASVDSLVSINGTNYFQRTFTLTDSCGQVGSCAQLFNISDTTPPVLNICATNRTNSANICCQATIPDLTGQVVATDCNQVTITQTPIAGTVVSLGNYVITLRATDAAGNFAICQSWFVVPDCSTNLPSVPFVPIGTNVAPILSAISNQSVLKGTTLSYTNSATDPDAGPTNRIAWKLIPLTPYAPVSPAGPRGVYNNYLGLETWRNSLGDTNPINVIALGDSITEGFNATDQNSKSWAAIVRSNLQSSLGNGGLGLIPIYRASGSSFTQFWTLNGSWIQLDPVEYGPFSSARHGSGSSSAQVTLFGDRADLFLVLTPSGATEGPDGAYYQVDNGPTNYFNTWAAVTTNSILDIPLGAPGNHTVKVVAPLDSGKYLGVWGISANFCVGGVRVHNVGRSGAKAGDASPSNSRSFIQQLRPRLTIIGFSSNDYASQTGTNAYRSNMIDLIQEGLATGSVLLVGANPRAPETNTVPQAVYHAILKELAFTYGCAFIDMRERWGNAALEKSLGLSTDQMYPTDSGHVEYAQTILSQLLPTTVAKLNPTNGIFSWATLNSEPLGTNFFRIIACDNGVPSLGATQVMRVDVFAINASPVIMSSALTNQTIYAGSSTGPLPFTIGDAETAVGSLSLVGSSSDTSIVSNASPYILFGGSGSNRTVTITPVAGRIGSTTITLTVSDGEVSTNATFTVSVITAPTNNCLITYWNFDEASGSTAFDVAGGNPGTLVNSPSRATGLSGRGLFFNGVNNYVNVPDSDSLDLTNLFSISLWFQPSSLLNAASGRRDLLQKFLSYWFILNYPGNDGRLAFVLNSGSPVIKTTTASWNAGQWYHIVATSDGTSLKLYVNGVLEASTPNTVVPVKNTSPLQIGGNSAQGFWFPGGMDEVRLYGCALTAGDIAGLYNQGGSTNPPPPPPVNTPPTISDIADRSIAADSNTGDIPFTVNDAQTSPGSLLVTATSGNIALVPNANLILGGSAGARTVRATPLAGLTGTALITITVSDGALSTNDTFLLTVTNAPPPPVNTPPTISDVADRSIAAGSNTGDIPFTVNDAQTSPGSLIVTASSGNSGLVPNASLVLGGSAGARTVRATPLAGLTGTALIAITVSDGALSTNDTFLLTVTNAPPPPPPPPIGTNQLISRWQFDEASGSTALDFNNLNPGTLVNGPLRVAGNIGSGALQFDGVNDHVNVPDSNSLDLSNRFTFAFWFKPSQLLNGSSGRKDLFQKFLSYWLILNYPANDGKLAFVLNSGSPTVKSTTSSWNANQWYHVAATYDGVTMKLYINGVLEGTTPTTLLPVNTANPLQIGGNSAQGFWFPGAMDDVRLYGSPLSAALVADLYNGLSPLLVPTAAIFPAIAITIEPENDLVVLKWTAQANRSYRVEYKDDLTAADWTPLPGEVKTSGGTVRAEDTLGLSTQRFYRVVIEP